ncbi:hypothetical protein FRC12_006326 [Ceratobasidium sp. 428]|nr:hypothetical protein FRC12_006326 [Ceratobasidium sp. 428]
MKRSAKANGTRKCPRCSEVCETSEDLGVHLRTHIVTSKNEILCPYPGCESRCAAGQRGNLYTHIKTHFNIKDQMCRYDGCSDAFGDPSSRNRHEYEAHVPGFGFLCQSCTLLFKRRVQFVDHWKLKHKRSPSKAEIKKAKQNPKKNNLKQVKCTEKVVTPVPEQNVASTSTSSNDNNVPTEETLSPAPSNSLPQAGNTTISDLSSCFNDQLNLDQTHMHPFDTDLDDIEPLSAEEAAKRNLELDMQQNPSKYLGVWTPSADSNDSAQLALPSQFNQYSLPSTSQPSPFAAVQPELAADPLLSSTTQISSLLEQINGMYASPHSIPVDQPTPGYQYSQQHHAPHQLRYNPYARTSDRGHYANDFSY